MSTVSSVFRFANGMILVCDLDGEQILELNGPVTRQRLESIRLASNPDTKWYGFDEDGPIPWATLASERSTKRN
jgi:hypothetical protein